MIALALAVATGFAACVLTGALIMLLRPRRPAVSRTAPQTFAERWRGMMSWMLFGAGVVCTALAVGALLIVWLGGWPVGTEGQRLTIVGWALLGALAGMMAVIVSLAIGGPVGRFKASVGRDGANFEAEDRHT